MAFCSSGVSGPKAGINDDIYITGTALSLAIAAVVPGGIAWLDPILALVVSELVLHAPTFCAADPPSDPGVTGANVAAALSEPGTPDGRAGAAAITQLAERFLWFQMCECKSVATPAVPTPPSEPSGTPAINPTNVSPPAATKPCLTYTYANELQDQSSFQLGQNFANGQLWTGLVYTLGTPTITGTLHAGSVQVNFIGGTPSSPVSTGNQSFTIPSTGILAPQTLTVPPGTTKIGFTMVGGVTGTGFANYTSQVDLYCNGDAPGGVVNPCCPPDATMVGQIQQILALVTLIQRQAVPFAYIAGTAHTGLTGTGSITVSGIVGLAVTLTTVPSQLGDEVGTPPRLFDAGWLNLGTVDGYERFEPLTSSANLIVPPVASLVTTVGYSLHSGVIATITELVREP